MVTNLNITDLWISPCNHAEVELLQLGVQEVEIVAPAVTNLENPLNKDIVDVDFFPDMFEYFQKNHLQTW